MYKVVKRDGTTVEFEITKIASAMVKAFEALEKPYHPSVINMLALQVSADFETKIKDGMITVEDNRFALQVLQPRKNPHRPIRASEPHNVPAFLVRIFKDTPFRARVPGS